MHTASVSSDNTFHPGIQNHLTRCTHDIPERLTIFDLKKNCEMTTFQHYLTEITRDRPSKLVILAVGSISWGPFRDKTSEFQKIAFQFRHIGEFISLYTQEANPLENWTVAKEDIPTLNPYRVPQPHELSERIPHVRRYIEDFHYQLPLVIDSFDPNSSVSRYLCGGDALWLGAFDSVNNQWRNIWHSGEIPYEYDMNRLKDFLLSKWVPNKDEFPAISEVEDNDL